MKKMTIVVYTKNKNVVDGLTELISEDIEAQGQGTSLISISIEEIRLYRIKLLDNHKAKKEDVVNGYLGNVFGDGKIAEYTRGEAIKKGRSFGGIIEEVKEATNGK